jgi:hypothetical protein
MTLLHAIYAGWIIALLVWVLPGAEHNKVAVIVGMTSWTDALAGFVLPSLIGNTVGGSRSSPR